MIRSFIAIDLTSEIRTDINQIMNGLRKGSNLPIRWTSAENIHITLKFLGEIDENQAMLVKQTLPVLLERIIPFKIEIGELGAFPKPERPKVIWIGSKFDPTGIELQRSIELKLSQLGFEKEERRFSPHLTLGRIANYASSGDLAAISQLIRNSSIGNIGTILVDAIHLFRSDLHPSGARYSKIASFSFK